MKRTRNDYRNDLKRLSIERLKRRIEIYDEMWAVGVREHGSTPLHVKMNYAENLLKQKQAQA